MMLNKSPKRKLFNEQSKLKILQRRDAILNEKKESKLDLADEYVRPIWEKLKSKVFDFITIS